MSMYPELTNLLPDRAAKSLRRGYFLRLFIVGTVLAIVVIVIHGVLLIPAYLYAHREAAREQIELNALSQKLATSNQKTAAARINAVKTDITYLGRLQSLPTGSGAVKGVLSVPHPGIQLSGFTFTAAESAKKPPHMTVAGTASTRDTLRAYSVALGALPYVTNADLPISAYAKDSDIPFVITLTGSLLP